MESEKKIVIKIEIAFIHAPDINVITFEKLVEIDTARVSSTCRSHRLRP
jgi:hypothetical protein